MTKNPPNRRGIVFEVGAQLEARDRLKKWYAALIEEINFEEGKVLIHFKHWNHRHDEWFFWDSLDLRPEEKIQLRKEGLHEQPVQPEFRVNQQVLACWSDCRFYPAKVTAVNKDGTYTVKFFDGVVQTVKNIHIKSFSKEQNVTCTKAKERNKEITSHVEKLKEKSNQQRSQAEHVKKEKELAQNIDEKHDLNKDELAVLSERVKLEHDEDNLICTSEESKKIAEKYKILAISEDSRADIEKDKIVVISKQSKLECDKDNLIAIFNESKGNPETHTLFCSAEKNKISEIHLPKNEKEDKENISENDKETLVDKPVEEKKNENSQKTQNRFSGRKRSKANSLPSSEQSSQTLQPIILELRRRKISIDVGVQSKRPRLGKCIQKPAKSEDLEQSPEKLKNLMNASEKSKVPRRSSRLSSSGLQEIEVPHVAPDPIVAECLKEKASTLKGAPQDDLLSNHSKKLSMPSPGFQNEDKWNKVLDNRKGSQTPRRSSRLSSSGFQEINLVHVTPTPVVIERLKKQDLCPMELVEGELQSNCSSEKIIKLVQFEETLNNSLGKSEEINVTQSTEQASNECREMLDIADVAPTPSLVEPLNEQVLNPNNSPDGDLLSVCSLENATESDSNVQNEEMLNSLDNCEIIQSMRRSPRLSPSRCPEMIDIINVMPVLAVAEPSKEEASGPNVLPDVILENSCVEFPSLETNELVISEDAIAAVEISSTAAEEKTESIDLLKSADIKELAALPADAVLKKSNEYVASKVLSNDLDHIKFKCKFKDCSKFFRKAKLLHYHMKYFHGVDKTEKAQKQVTRTIQTRGSLANEKANLEIPKRRRTTSGSMHTPLRLELRNAHSNDKTEKRNEKRRHSVPSSSTLNIQRPMQRDKRKEPHVNKSHRKQPEMQKQNDNATKEKEKCKEKKSKDFLRLKLKKKKKKKKKSKSECSASEENVEIAQELSPKKSQISMKANSTHKAPYCHESTPLQKSDLDDQVKKNEEDTLSDSSADSFLWSEEEYSQEIDVTTNPEEILDDDEHDYEIVRCMCEVQEENDFMIQCEECLCWQHGVCMGLLEDNVPTKYTCFICRKPPGQRPGLKYWYDKGWLNNGHLHGLSFLEENYSHQNAKKIVATHQLLADVHRVIELLHGLQLKMSILQSKDHPDLKLWCLPWKQHSMNDKCYPKQSFHTANCCKDEAKYRTFNGAVEKSSIPSVEESYITSEHCYQKPRAYYPAIEQRLVVETRGSAVDDGVNRRRENGEDALTGRMGWQLDKDKSIMESDSKHNYCKVRECVPKKCSSEDALEMKLMDSNCDSVLNTQLQWQLNLLSHVESLQDEVTHRMDFIEKELDVLESFLDYTGELEPPEPLARLPQLKHRIKQLLMDLGKVQQIAVCCSTCI